MRELVETRADFPRTLGEAFAGILRRRGVDDETAAAMTAPTSSSSSIGDQLTRQARTLMLPAETNSRRCRAAPVRIRGLSVVAVEKAVYLPSYESPDDDLMMILPQFRAEDMGIRVITMVRPSFATSDGVLRWLDAQGSKVPAKELPHRTCETTSCASWTRWTRSAGQRWCRMARGLSPPWPRWTARSERTRTPSGVCRLSAARLSRGPSRTYACCCCVRRGAAGRRPS